MNSPTGRRQRSRHVLLSLLLSVGLMTISSLSMFAGKHLERDVPVALEAPWTAGHTWQLTGSYFGEGEHTDENNDYYATDWNKVGTSCDGDAEEWIRAPADGTVTGVGTAGGGIGNYVRIRLSAAPSVTVHFYHLKDWVVTLNEGVEPGDLIGRVGDTGLASNACAHMHIGFRQTIDGTTYSIRPGAFDGHSIEDGVQITAAAPVQTVTTTVNARVNAWQLVPNFSLANGESYIVTVIGGQWTHARATRPYNNGTGEDSLCGQGCPLLGYNIGGLVLMARGANGGYDIDGNGPSGWWIVNGFAQPIRLYFRINDGFVSDNDGILTVRVTKTTTKSAKNHDAGVLKPNKGEKKGERSPLKEKKRGDIEPTVIPKRQ